MTNLKEDEEAGDPEAGEEDEVEHCDLQPGQGGSAVVEGFLKCTKSGEHISECIQ